MPKPGSIKKEKRKRNGERESKRDREIDLEKRPLFLYLSSHRDPCQKSSFAIPKAPALPWIRNKGRRQSEWGRSRKREERGLLPLVWPDPLPQRPSSLDLAISPVSCQHTSWGIGPKQKVAQNKVPPWCLQLPAPLCSKTLNHWPRWHELPQQQREYSFGELPWNTCVLPHRKQQQQLLNTQQSPCHLTPFGEARTCYSLLRIENTKLKKRLKKTFTFSLWNLKTTEAPVHFALLCILCGAYTIAARGCLLMLFFIFYFFYTWWRGLSAGRQQTFL